MTTTPPLCLVHSIIDAVCVRCGKHMDEIAPGWREAPVVTTPPTADDPVDWHAQSLRMERDRDIANVDKMHAQDMQAKAESESATLRDIAKGLTSTLNDVCARLSHVYEALDAQRFHNPVFAPDCPEERQEAISRAIAHLKAGSQPQDDEATVERVAVAMRMRGLMDQTEEWRRQWWAHENKVVPRDCEIWREQARAAIAVMKGS